MSKKAKIAGITILIVLLVIFTVLDGWWLYVLIYMPDKEVVNTYYVGTISTETEDYEEIETEYIFKVKYFTNQNKNGLECLEIEFTGFLDENQETFYHMGLQFVADSDTATLSDWDSEADMSSRKNKRTVDSSLVRRKVYYDVWNSVYPVNGSIYAYQSSDNFINDVTNRVIPIDDVIISLGGDDDLYMLSFKNNYKDEEFDNYMGQGWVDFFTDGFLSLRWNWEYNNYYVNYDAYAFAYYLYNSIQAVPNGKKSASLINIPEMFDYKQYNGQTFDDVSEVENDKVSELVRNYYSIFIEKTADGIQTANDSLFGVVQGTSEFNYIGDDGSSIVDNGEYFSGKTVVNCDLYDFDFVEVRDSVYALKLSESFNSYYGQYSQYIQLSICIDLDIFNENGYEFYGFTKDSGLSKFTILECYSVQTVDGEIVKLEVEYA